MNESTLTSHISKITLKKYTLGGISSNIENMFLLYSSVAFKIYEAVLKENVFGNDSCKEIYIVQLKFLDFSITSDIDVIINSIISKYPSNFILNTSGLKRVGFIKNEHESNISFVYLKEGNQLFNLEVFLNEFYPSMGNYSLIKFQMIYDLLVASELLHSQGKKIGLIHPNLIFFNKETNAFSFIDFIYDELLSLADKANISQILPHFGYFSYEDIDVIEKGYDALTKKYEDNYYKTDNVLILSLLNFLFTPKKQFKKEEIGTIKTFEEVIKNLHKDFILVKHKLTNFLTYNSDFTVKSIIEDCLFLDYSTMKSTNYLITQIGKLIKKELIKEQCISCQDINYNKHLKSTIQEEKDMNATSQSNIHNNQVTSTLNKPELTEVAEEENNEGKTADHATTQIITKNSSYDFYNKKYLDAYGKRIHNVCYHLLCKFCYDSHICEKISNKQFIQAMERKEENKKKLTRIKEHAERSEKIEIKRLLNHFRVNVEPYTKQVTENHIYLERLIKYEEEIINSLIDYINNLINQYEEKERKIIQNQIYISKERLFTLLYQIEVIKLNTVASDKINMKNILDKSRLIENMNVTPNNISQSDLNDTIKGQIEKILEKKNFHTLDAEKIDGFLDTFGLRVKSINEYKDSNNSKNKQFSLLIKELSRYSVNYKNEIQSIFKNEFQQFIRQLEILYEFLDASEIKKAISLTTTEEMTSYGHIRDNMIYIYDSKTSKVHSLSKNFNFKFSRCLNISKKILITGGLIEINKEFSQINHFLVIKYDIKEDKGLEVDEPKTLESMNYNRDQHCFVKLNEFELMVIGGYATSTCEIYSFLTKKWERVASLNECLYNSTAYVFNDLDVYVFFGLIGNEENNRKAELSYSYKIERFKLYDTLSMNCSEKWVVIDVKLPEKYPCVILSGTYSDNQSEIYILGGKTIENNSDYTNKILSFNINSYETKIIKYRLPSEACFTQSTFLKLNDVVSQFSENDTRLIRLDV